MRSATALVAVFGSLVLAFFWIYGWSWRTWSLLVLTTAFIPFAWSQSRKEVPAERRNRAMSQTWRWSSFYVPTLMILSCSLYLAVGYSAGAGFLPVEHDEHAYLFQARTLAASRISYPSHPLCDFFQAFHILTEPVYASKYPPGHALFLVPGLWVGFPMLVPVLVSAGSLALVFLLTKQVGGAWLGLATTATFALSPAQVLQATSFSSHTTSLFWILVFLLNVVLWIERSTERYSLIAGVGLGVAFLIRPYSALSIGGPIIVYCLYIAWKNRVAGVAQRIQQVLVLLLGPALAAVLLLSYNLTLLGNPLRFPWSEYASQYMPADGLGFGISATAPKRSLLPNQAAFYNGYVLPQKREYTVANAIGIFFSDRVPSLLRFADPGLGITVFFLMAIVLPKTPIECLLLTVILSHAVAQFFYYGSMDRYLFEIVPLVIYFSVKACVWLYRECQDRGCQVGKLFLEWHGAAGVLLLVAFQTQTHLQDKQKVTAYSRSFSRLLQTLNADPKVILVRYKADHDYHQDLINNEPDIDGSKTIFAYDLGEQNEKLLRYFMGRRFYLFDEKTWTITEYPSTFSKSLGE